MFRHYLKSYYDYNQNNEEEAYMAYAASSG